MAQHGVLTSRQLLDRGVTHAAIRHRVDWGVLVVIKRAIYRLRDHPWTWDAQLQALLFDGGPRALVSHRAAARLHGFRRYRRSSVVEITGPEIHDHRVTLGRFHRSSRLPVEHRTVVAGFPVTSVARTCFDLMGDPDPGLGRSEVGIQIHGRNMMRVVNDALRRRGLTLGQLVAVRVELAKRGRPGSALAREIVARLSESYEPTESEGEDLFVELVTLYDLPQPKRQVHLSDEERGWVAKVDFLYPELTLVIEIDGQTHDGPLDKENDARRDAELRAMGYDVWRIRYRELLLRPERVATELRRRLADAA